MGRHRAVAVGRPAGRDGACRRAATAGVEFRRWVARGSAETNVSDEGMQDRALCGRGAQCGSASVPLGRPAIMRGPQMQLPMAERPCFPERRADAGGAPPVRAEPGAGRGRLGQDTGHRAQDRAAAAKRHRAEAHRRHHLHQQGGGRDARACQGTGRRARTAKELAISTFHSLGVRMLRSDGAEASA